jgi:hypothetical protein
LGPMQSYAFIEEYWPYDHAADDVLCRWAAAPSQICAPWNMDMCIHKHVSKHVAICVCTGMSAKTCLTI